MWLGRFVGLALGIAMIGMSLPVRATPAACDPLERATVERSVSLAIGYLRHNQRPAGNFVYAYDWHTRQQLAEDSEVRQAGASWGLSLAALHQPDPDTLAAARRSLRFFAGHSRLSTDGARYIVYPGSRHGSIGTVALVTLAHIELLRAGAKDDELVLHLNQYLRFIAKAHRRQGGFLASYRHDSGAAYGKPSPYFDGESLLAWVKAARYLDRNELLAPLLAEVEQGYAAHVKAALAADPDPAATKGYYQWSSMAYYELATWARTRSAPQHGDRLLHLADWMVDVHHTLRRRRNTAYAYEGLVLAYALAQQRADQARTDKLACVIHQGLSKLIAWQVGGPLPNLHIAAAARADQRALGGVQNEQSEPLLRIDVTQHQLHALLLTLSHVLVAPP